MSGRSGRSARSSSHRHSPKMGDVASMLHLLKPLDGHASDPVTRKRRLLADVCRLIGDEMNGKLNPGSQPEGKTHVKDALRKGVPVHGASNANDLGEAEPLSPRLRQTLQSLLAGDSEKQVARRLGLSHHTVHVYVKTLYRRFGVSSRGELLARWVKNN